MGKQYFHFELKLGVILHSVLNLNVTLKKKHIKRARRYSQDSVILNCKRGYYKYHITLQIRRRPGLKMNTKHDLF